MSKAKPSKVVKPTVITKFREFWKGLSDGEQTRLWGILAGTLRGPDNTKEGVYKYKYTFPLRNYVFGMWLANKTTRKDLNELYSTLPDKNPGAPYSHYISHIRTAIMRILEK